jgi:hypothetical protein
MGDIVDDNERIKAQFLGRDKNMMSFRNVKPTGWWVQA